MKYLFGFLGVSLVVMSTVTSFAGQTDDAYIQVPFNLGFIHGLSISDLVRQANPGKKITHNGVSLAPLSAGAEQLNGVALSGIWSGYSEDANGVQLSGVLNTVGGNANGIQMAGVANVDNGDAMGIHLAGVLNSVSKNANVVQLSGVANFTGGKAQGLFIASVLNFASAEVDAVQISGLANVSGKMRGIQIGVFNIAEELDGIPIGLISYVKNVGLHQDLWADETRFVHLGLRSGGQEFYNLLSVGVRVNEPMRWAVGWGIGRHIAAEFFPWEIELSSYSVFNNGLNKEESRPESSILKLRLMGIFGLGQSVSLVAGATLNLFISHRDDGFGLIPWSISSSRTADGTWIRVWPGFIAGVRF